VDEQPAGELSGNAKTRRAGIALPQQLAQLVVLGISFQHRLAIGEAEPAQNADMARFMSAVFLNSYPYPWPFDGNLTPANTALIIIDMQIDFCGAGGYDISLTRKPIEPLRKLPTSTASTGRAPS
jgi:hypothetical protein